MGNRPSKSLAAALSKQSDSTVSLSWEQINFIPDEIFQKTSLKTLILDFNQITEIPRSISHLTQLKELSIAANRLNSLPAQLATVTSLTKLNIGLNRVSKLRTELFHNLTNLQELYIDDNPIPKIPVELSRLNSLHSFSACQNGLERFFETNPDFAFPRSLSCLKLMGNYLTHAPSLMNMDRITVLDLNENCLRALPASLTNLHSLKRLFLACNELETLPAGFGNGWPELTTLQIAFNNFTSLPEEILKLPKLTYFDIRGNPLPIALHPELRIESIPNLLTLLSHPEEELQEVPKEIKISIEINSPRPDLILPNVYLGCVECAKNKQLLRELKITHVLTVARFQPFYPTAFKYKVVEIDDANHEDIFSHFDSCVKFIESAIASGNNVLIHCRAGVSRSASVVSAYVMLQQKLSRDKAIEYVKARRARILPNDGFYDQLGKWEKRLGLCA